MATAALSWSVITSMMSEDVIVVVTIAMVW